MNPHLNSAGEQFWLELRQHVAWADRFSLIFIFCSDFSLTGILRQRLTNYLSGRVTRHR